MNGLYDIKKFHKIGDHYLYIYELKPNYAVVEYKDDEDLIYSQFFFQWKDALHKYNEIKKEELCSKKN